MTATQQINLQTDTLYKQALTAYFDAGLDIRNHPYLMREIRVQCRLLAVMSVKQAGMIATSLEQVQTQLKSVKESREAQDVSKFEQKVDRLGVEIKTLTQVVARLQKGGGASVAATTPSQTWKEYVKSPAGITGIVLGGLLFLNLIF